MSKREWDLKDSLPGEEQELMGLLKEATRISSKDYLGILYIPCSEQGMLLGTPPTPTFFSCVIITKDSKIQTHS